MAPEHFTDGSPLELLPLGARQIVIHGDADDASLEMSRRYVAAAGPRPNSSRSSHGPLRPIDPHKRRSSPDARRDRATPLAERDHAADPVWASIRSHG
jgi:hypothetical protein